MPHYKDGTPAEIGDTVKGKPYNTDHEIVGTLIQITEGSDSCNCIVAFAETKVTKIPINEFNQQGIVPVPLYIYRVVGGRIKQDNSIKEHENVLIIAKYDYGAVSDFVKLA